MSVDRSSHTLSEQQDAHPSAMQLSEQIKQIQSQLQQGNFPLAEQQGELMVKQLNALNNPTLKPQQLENLYVLAVCYRLQRKYSLAINTLKQLLAIEPEHSRGEQELGYNARAMGNIQQASLHFYQATKRNPALLSAWQALLPIYQQQKQTAAVSLCQKQIAQLQALPRPLLAATDLLHEGKLAAADDVCRGYLREHKHSLQGLLLLAEIAVRLKAISQAEFILETCIELNPKHAEAKYQLFKIYSKLGKFALALDLAEKLTEIDSDNIFYRLAKATALVGVGEITLAITIYLDVIRTQKAEANVYLLLGHAYKTQGDIEKSVSAYQQAYAIESYCGDAYWSLANTKTYHFSDDEINTMLAGTKKAEVDSKNKVHLHFALGKAYEDMQQYQNSFTHYQAGNQLQRAGLNYSSDSHAQAVQAQIDVFTPSLINTLKHNGHADSAPIFIVGLPRAGSTLLEQILASHSKVDGTMELHDVLGLAANLSKHKGNAPVYPYNIDTIPPEYFAKFGQKFIQDTRVYRRGGAYFIDKMPNNYMHIGLIKLILPNAKIIDARRHPMACCFSGYKQLFGEGQEFSYNLRDIGEYYQHYVRLMDHWQQVFPDQILLVKHENVVKDTEAEIRRILSFCGLEFEQACVDFHQNKRAVNTPSAQQVRQPIYQSGLAQWKHFEPYLGELRACFD